MLGLNVDVVQLNDSINILCSILYAQKYTGTHVNGQHTVQLALHRPSMSSSVVARERHGLSIGHIAMQASSKACPGRPECNNVGVATLPGAGSVMKIAGACSSLEA